MAKGITVAPIGDNRRAIFSGVREFPTKKVYLLSTVDAAKVRATKRELEGFGVAVDIIRLRGDLWEGTFRAVAELQRIHPDLIINVAAANDPKIQCIATCAAFVNGLRAFGVDETGEPMLLPILKFSYYSLLTDKKLSLLKALDNPECCASLHELGRKSEMSLPLVSYHINGNSKTPGLIGLGLAETHGRGRKTSIHLTELGRMISRGYINP